MWSHLIVALVAAMAAWTAQGWRLGERLAEQKRAYETQAAQRERELAEDRTEHTRLVLRAERSRHAQIAQAEQAARGREVALRRAAVDLRAERDQLRDASAAAVRTARESPAACPERAAALQAVFDQCTGAVEDLAGKADRHASDARTLIEAWPRDVVPGMADSPAPEPPPE